MKICIISFEFKPLENGITISLERIARNLSLEGHEIHILCFGKRSQNPFHQLRTELITEKREFFVHRIEPFSGDVQYPDPLEINVIIQYLKELDNVYNFDLIHGFRLIPGGYTAVMAALELKKPCVVSVRGSDLGRNIYDYKLFEIIRFTLERADKITFVSNDLLEMANNIIPIKKKSTIIYNSFDINNYYYVDINLKLKGTVMGTSGIMRGRKGLIYALEAYRKYKERKKSSFLLIGDFLQEEKDSYENILKDYTVTKTGRVLHKYILNYINKLDVFILPSLIEGCSNAMLEAMYLKKPIITTEIGAAKDILKDACVYVKKMSPDDIYEGLIKLENEGFKNKLIDNAYYIVNSELIPRKEMKKWLDLYKL